MKKILMLLVGIMLMQFEMSAKAATNDWDLLACGVKKCPKQLLQCATEGSCRKTLACNRDCGGSGSKADQQACHLVCQLGLGKESKIYPELVTCFAQNECLPKLEPGKDGICPVNETNAKDVVKLNSISDLDGTWLELKGLNCGKAGSGWEGGYDALPCRSSSWVYSKDLWWYHTSFCKPGKDQYCENSSPVHLLARPSLSLKEAGLIEVPYIDPPLKPQEERWYVLAHPHPDWMMYTYCGSTPAGSYAGLNIASRDPDARYSGIPQEVDVELRKAAAKFGVDYDSLCENEHKQCPAIRAREDVERALLDSPLF
ncbi:MAG: hypothetical protein HRU09_13140 [Oligoflexales bacterium]|nr:hypothetical protein [Oligoflexales bacterium]